MQPVLEALPNLLGYSVPTVLVIGGLVLFFLPFFKDMQPRPMKSAKIYGIIIGVIGIGLALLIKPTEKQPQLVPVYILPTPVNISLPDGSIEPTAISTSPSALPSPSNNIPTVQVTATDRTGAEQPVSTESPPSPTLPVSLPVTPTPEPVTSVISAWAIEENGVRINISTSGIYKVAYLDGAYSPWPNEQYEGYRGWTTTVRIYVNRPVEWGQTEYGLVGPINQNDYLGSGGYYLDMSQAIATSAGDSRTFRLNAGDYLTLVALDEKGRYSDNQGKVDIGVTYLGQ